MKNTETSIFSVKQVKSEHCKSQKYETVSVYSYVDLIPIKAIFPFTCGKISGKTKISNAFVHDFIYHNVSWLAISKKIEKYDLIDIKHPKCQCFSSK